MYSFNCVYENILEKKVLLNWIIIANIFCHGIAFYLIIKLYEKKIQIVLPKMLFNFCVILCLALIIHFQMYIGFWKRGLVIRSGFSKLATMIYCDLPAESLLYLQHCQNCCWKGIEMATIHQWDSNIFLCVTPINCMYKSCFLAMFNKGIAVVGLRELWVEVTEQ